jgi:hypothetical protein
MEAAISGREAAIGRWGSRYCGRLSLRYSEEGGGVLVLSFGADASTETRHEVLVVNDHAHHLATAHKRTLSVFGAHCEL